LNLCLLFPVFLYCLRYVYDTLQQLWGKPFSVIFIAVIRPIFGSV
jgi:hypothetical protein